MKLTILDDAETDSLNEVLDTIKRYEDGDTSLEDDILEVIGAIWSFTSSAKKRKKEYKKSVKLCKKGINNNLKVDSLLESLNDELNLYDVCIKTLGKYIKYGFKTDNFPDLESAYLLTVYASNILSNINDYIDEITAINKCQQGLFVSSGNKNLEDTCTERRNNVKKLIAVLNNEQVDEEI